MNLDDIYSSWLKASMIEDRVPLVVTVQKWSVVEFEDKSKIGGVKKQIAIEVGEKAPLGLNVTNAKMIAHYLGTEDPNQWVGQQIVLNVEMVDSFGKLDKAIRIASPQAVQQYQQPPIPQAAQTANPAAAQGLRELANPAQSFEEATAHMNDPQAGQGSW